MKSLRSLHENRACSPQNVLHLRQNDFCNTIDPVQTFLPVQDLSGCRYDLSDRSRPCLLSNGHRALKELFGIGIATLMLVETGQVLQNVREIRMVRTERLLEGGH